MTAIPGGDDRRQAIGPDIAGLDIAGGVRQPGEELAHRFGGSGLTVKIDIVRLSRCAIAISQSA
ncbi:hypothetical protein M3484_03390 [Pseudomonas sp. GX19020]|uniref:hypothetical protein n=1 Tax=Pseudomonas sp. GX19020 TaxID=2942277 RepID=UPI0020198196|nr:hypothetical protein [Pseudomonas sp. GX19020]MCL4065616.1 hypothetical protein [Pseudomonas sp. GX19020]